MSAHLAMCAAYTCDHATHILDPINTIRTQTRQSKLIVTMYILGKLNNIQTSFKLKSLFLKIETSRYR